MHFQVKYFEKQPQPHFKHALNRLEVFLLIIIIFFKLNARICNESAHNVIVWCI